MGCSNQRSEAGYSILFDSQGKERSNPSIAVDISLLDSRGEEKQKSMLKYYTSVLSKGGGYSRIAVAKSLLSFYSEHPDFYTEDSSKAIASIIEIAPSSPDASPEIVREIVEVEGLPLWAKRRVHLQCRIDFDGEGHVIADSLPKGWWVRDVKVTVEGKVLRYEKEDFWPDDNIDIDLGQYLTGNTPRQSQLSLLLYLCHHVGPRSLRQNV
jgi:hypothetical protein